MGLVFPASVCFECTEGRFQGSSSLHCVIHSTRDGGLDWIW